MFGVVVRVCRMKPITVLLAEDFSLLRQGLRALLENEEDIEVIGEAETGRRSVHLTMTLSPDVVVMDISLPGLNGLEATRQIRKLTPSVKVLILSAHSDSAYVEQAVTLGAAGYITKQTAGDVLPRAIREVNSGNTFFNHHFTANHTDHIEKPISGWGLSMQKSPGLTSREVEVLQLVAEGEANKQIASKLGISVKTVEKHRDHLQQKLDIHETASLTRYAIEAGIITLRPIVASRCVC